MKHLTTLILLTLPFVSFVQSEAKIVFNDDVHVNIKNDAYLVIDNPNEGALMNTENGLIHSEGDEENIVRWNVGNQTGNYVIPWSTPDNVKIPLKIKITSAGNSDGYFDLSTYRTDSENKPYANEVNNVCSASLNNGTGGDAGHKAIDRFWVIDAQYSHKPDVALSFGYDFSNEGAQPNDIEEHNLQAQRFNPTYGEGDYCNDDESTGSWQDLMFGHVNNVGSTSTVEEVEIEGADFFKNWTLVDNTTPLPIELISFVTTCQNGVTIQWTTGSENNISHFEIYRSRNGETWELIETVDAVGNSVSENTYEIVDENGGLIYYKLLTVDYDGKYKEHGPVAANCDFDASSWTAYPVPASNEITIDMNALAAQSDVLYITDVNGKTIFQRSVDVMVGNNIFYVDLSTVAKGMYFVHLMHQKEEFKTLKLVKL